MSTGVRTLDRVSFDTRDRLVHAAAEVFREEGYERTRMSEVARRAGLTTGAIYANFRGKSELLRAAIEHGTAELAGQMTAARRAGARPIQLLRNLGVRLMLPPRNVDRRLTVEAFAAARRDPEVAALMRDSIAAGTAELTRLVEAARRQGDVAPPVDTAALVWLIQAIGFGHYVMEGLGARTPDPESWNALLDHLVAAFGYGEVPHAEEAR